MRQPMQKTIQNHPETPTYGRREKKKQKADGLRQSSFDTVQIRTDYEKRSEIRELHEKIRIQSANWQN